MKTTYRALISMLLLTAPWGAWGQYQASPQQGVSYPALTNPVPIVLTAAGTNDPNDRGRSTVTLGFDFPFYNRVYSQLTVTANGLLFLEPSSGANTAADFSGNVALPGGAEPNGLIAPFWDDLVGDNATSALQRQAISGPNGQGLAIEFKDWNRVFGAFTLTFQVRLWANGIIEFFYGTMSGAGATSLSATIGIESPSGTASTRGLNTCTTDCALTSFDPGGTGTPITYIRFGPPTGVDLQALTLRVAGISQAGADLSLATVFTMRNFGTAASGDFGYALFLSEDTLYDSSDIPVTPSPPGPFSLGPLAGISHTHTGTVAQPDGGSWYVLATIPVVTGETNAFNNVVASSVPYAAGVDLTAESIRPPLVAGPGDPVSIDVAFSNQGFEPAGAVGVKIFASVDTALSPDDRLLTSQSFTVQGGAQVSSPVVFPLTPSIPADDYFVLLLLDDGADGGVIAERSELNNFVASSNQMQIRQADLTVTAVRVHRATAPYDELVSAFFGEPTRFEAFVSNVGGARVGSVNVDFFLSDNESLNGISDSLIGSVAAGALAPGESRWVTLPSASLPTRGTGGQELIVQSYFVFAAASSPGLVELNQANNFGKSRPTVLRAPAPNLIPVEMETPLRAGAGELVAVSRTIANLGNRNAGGSAYRFYLSANSIVTSDDIPLKRVTPSGEQLDGTLGPLAIDQRDSAVELVRLPQTLASTPYYIGILVDPAGTLDESEEGDNGLAGRRTDMVAQALMLATPSLPDGTLGLPYWTQLTAQGSPGPFTFSVAPGSAWPAGLTLSSTGLLSGTPTVMGAFTVMFQIEANGRSVVAARALRVAPVTSSLQLSSVALPAPARLMPYRAELGAAGGAGRYTYKLIGGVLPVGLTLSTSGELSGIPSDPLGTSRTFGVRVTDAVGNVDEATFTVVIVDGSPFTIRTRSLKDGQLGGEYLESLVAVDPSGSAVVGPVSWKVIEGELPPGLVTEPSQSDTLVISGTPSRPGRYRFTLEAVDGQGRSDSYTYLVSILAGTITTSTTGTQKIAPGGSVSVQFGASPLPAGAKWFWRDGELPPGVSFAEDGSVTGLVDAQAPLGMYSFTVGVGLSPAQLLSMASWSIEVSTEQEKPRSSCSSTGDLTAWLLGLLLALRLSQGRVRGSHFAPKRL